MKSLIHCPIIHMVSVSAIDPRAHIDLAMNSLSLKPTCGTAILTAALSALVI